jgi:hypothetical protein
MRVVQGWPLVAPAPPSLRDHREEEIQMKRVIMKIAVSGTVLMSMLGTAVTTAPVASAHNRAHVILPTGECIVVGSEKSVTLPDGSMLDLRPETTPADEFGTSFAAEEGNSALEKGPCP